MNYYCLIIILIVCQLSHAQEPSELLFNSTIKIQGYKDVSVTNKKQTVLVSGTGFYFAFQLINGKDTLRIPTIVTNQHNIANVKTGVLRFTVSSNNKPQYGKIVTVSISDFEKLWIVHRNEDLAILPLQPIINKIRDKRNVDIHIVEFSETDIPTLAQENELTALEEVLMIGYPKGLSDSVNNLPILRKGTTATPVYIDYNRQRRFLLDIPIYPGSSGSPIVVYHKNYTDKSGALVMGTRLYLLGIAVESQNYIAKGETVSADHTKKAETRTWLPFEIAIIIKSSELLSIKKLLQDAISNKTYSDLLQLNINRMDIK